MASTRIHRAWDWVAAHPPPGPFRPGFFRSPLRGPWLTSVLGEAAFERLAEMAATTRRLIDLAVPRIAAGPATCGCAGMAPDPALPMGSA